MLILAFSTSTNRGSVAVARDRKILGSVAWTHTAHGSEMLTQKIKSLLSKLKIKPEKISAVAVDRGPGSFTGCRIAAGVAKTMAFTLNIPLAAIPSMDILAAAAATPGRHKGRILAILDAHRSLLFARWFECDPDQGLRPVTDVESVSVGSVEAKMDPKGLPEVLIVGQGPEETLKKLKKLGAKTLKQSSANFPQAKVLALMAFDLGPEKFQSWREVEPIYIRAPDAVERMEKLRASLSSF